jgi:PAS domain S-box-containing protein
MERPAVRLLPQTSDAVAVVRLDDGLVVDVNQALLAMTGHRAEELVGRSSHELVVWATVGAHLGTAAGLRKLRSVGEVPAGFRTRAGELRMGDLSVLVVALGGRRHGVCALRAGRDPTAAERRAVARLGRAAVAGTVAGQEGATALGLELRRDPLLLQELALGVGRLNRLLEGIVERDRPTPEPVAAAPAGLTLKAVSERTGIPAATVRTWERRYGVLRPTRSSSGYRLYGEDDISKLLEVRRLLEHGVRIGEAMAALTPRG